MANFIAIYRVIIEKILDLSPKCRSRYRMVTNDKNLLVLGMQSFDKCKICKQVHIFNHACGSQSLMQRGFVIVDTTENDRSII